MCMLNHLISSWFKPFQLWSLRDAEGRSPSVTSGGAQEEKQSCAKKVMKQGNLSDHMWITCGYSRYSLYRESLWSFSIHWLGGSDKRSVWGIHIP